MQSAEVVCAAGQGVIHEEEGAISYTAKCLPNHVRGILQPVKMDKYNFIKAKQKSTVKQLKQFRAVRTGSHFDVKLGSFKIEKET